MITKKQLSFIEKELILEKAQKYATFYHFHQSWQYY